MANFIQFFMELLMSTITVIDETIDFESAKWKWYYQVTYVVAVFIISIFSLEFLKKKIMLLFMLFLISQVTWMD